MSPSRLTRPDRPTHALFGQGSVLIDWLLAVSLLLLILMGVARFSIRELERAEVNAAAIELSGWLEVIARSSMRLTTASCVVTFMEAPDGAAAGEVVASVVPEPSGLPPEICNPEPNFRLPAARGSSGVAAGPHITTRFPGAGGATVTFTPRGTVTNVRDFDLVIRHKDNTSIARCIRVNAISGLIEIGRNDTDAHAPCPEDSFSDLI